jgi:hypothetical protein
MKRYFLLLFAAVVSVCFAAGVWSPATSLTPVGTINSLLPPPAVGVDASGGAVAVMVPPGAASAGKVAASYRQSGGAWSPVSPISLPGEYATSPVVAVAPDGTAIAAWSSSDFVARTSQVRVAFRSPGHVFGRPIVVATYPSGTFAGARSIAAAIDAMGRVVLAYAVADATGKSQVFGVTGTIAGLGAPAVLSSANQDAALPVLAANRNGQAVVTWQVVSPDPNAYGAGVAVAAVMYSPSIGWSTAKIVASGADIWNASVGIDGAGRALAAWSQGPINWIVPNQIRIATSSAAGNWSAARTVSSGSGWFVEPTVAVDQAGNAVVAWQTYTDNSGLNTRIDAVRRVGYAGGFSQPVKVSASAVSALLPRAAAAPDGSLFAITWEGAGVVTATTPGGAFGAPTMLGGAQVFTPVAVAAGAGGHAAVVWNRTQPGRHRMVVAASNFD